MRVLYLTGNPYRVGSTAPLEGWLRHLPAKGLEPVLVSRQAGPFQKWAAEQGIPTYEIPLPLPNKLWPWQLLTSLLRLRRVVKRHRIDVIHCNEQEMYPISQYLSRWCRVPVVVSVHFTMSREFCTWAFSGRRSPKRIFFISQGNLEACRPGITGIVPESAWRLLPNGIDVEQMKPDAALREQFRRQYNLEHHTVLGAACALRPVKQLEHVFEATSQLKDPRLKFVLAGGAPRTTGAFDEGYPDAVIRRGRELLGDRFLHVGRLEGLQAFYSGIDLCVNASQMEGASISILESLACGCPVVGYPSTSVHEQVLPTGGEIVEQNSVERLAEALDRWAADPARLATARAGARQRVTECFDIRALSLQLWNEYQTLRS
jgi:glycosyltransferase involved in cell wall biosynthesis